LFVSGYASDVTAFHGLPGLAANVLAKPFGMDTLVRRVRAILDEGTNRGGAGPDGGHKWEPIAQEAHADRTAATAGATSATGSEPTAEAQPGS
jgi:DNA-binding response OmpR family regulator